ncbi:hypothetical protein G7054_g925 [Neopestalotiopsis clavispora]|nr:hypothetical protein G7054_g925 [Neopestalotiopsis clavispora]
MPRFPVNFRRRSTVTEDQNGPVEPSFRVLERSDAAPGKSFDGGMRMTKAGGPMPRTTLHDVQMDDNIFADTKNNRGSGSSNTTKTNSDNSSRHSNVSTAPSSTDYATTEDFRNSTRKSAYDAPLPAPPRSSGSGFLKNAGRTFSFGMSKKNHPAQDENVPPVPELHDPQTPGGRPRAPTASTVTERTPPQVEDRDFKLDLGGDLSNMLSAFGKRSSVMTLRRDSGQPALASRDLTGNRASQPAALSLDHSTAVEPPPKSWASQRSDEGLLGARGAMASPPPVPRHAESPVLRRKTPEEDEDAKLLKDSRMATKFLAHEDEFNGNDDTISNLKETYARPPRFELQTDEDNMFDNSYSRSRNTGRPTNRGNGPAQNKVMTPAEFEKYRQDKVRQSRSSIDKDSENEDEEDYEDDEDDRQKNLELAKQRRKQEAHMTVYRQTMMKVTGEQGGMAPRPGLATSMSAPNLLVDESQAHGGSQSPPSDGSSDEEVPLAILAAHGFPNKARPPTRLSNMASIPDLRGLNQPSYIPGPGSVSGGGAKNLGGQVPAFARKLPQDPFLGAGLINQPPRESFALAGGAPAQGRTPMPTGGLVGVIANEERAKALRRGSPAIDHNKNGLPPQLQMPMNGFDPMAQIPPQMMYPQQPMLTPGDQAQIQMTQQMQQFMQMQMQFMQMMAGQQNNQAPQMQMQMPMGMQMPGGASRPVSHMPTQSMSSMPDARQSYLGSMTDVRQSFMGDSMMGMGTGMNLEPPRPAGQTRTMSMVQPSSSSWVQPLQGSFGAPSIRVQGGGYAPSIAPSERSNIGLPGRYRPVSSLNPLDVTGSRSNTMSGALPTLSKLQAEVKTSPLANADDDDDEEGWAAMKAKREQKKSSWRNKKTFGSDIGALIT